MTFSYAKEVEEYRLDPIKAVYLPQLHFHITLLKTAFAFTTPRSAAFSSHASVNMATANQSPALTLLAVGTPIRRDAPSRTAARLTSQHYCRCRPAPFLRPASVRACARADCWPMGAPLMGRVCWNPRACSSPSTSPRLAPAPRSRRPAPPRPASPRSSPAAVAGTAVERGGPGLREAERPLHRRPLYRRPQPRWQHDGCGGDVLGRVLLCDRLQGGRITPASRPLCSRGCPARPVLRAPGRPPGDPGSQAAARR